MQHFSIKSSIDTPAKKVASLKEVAALMAKPFHDLLYQAHQTHRQHFAADEVQISTLMSIKTGGCPEDCAYCPQSVHHQVQLEKDRLSEVDEVIAQAKAAKASGATRFCMGAAYRRPGKAALKRIGEMISEVRALGLETCATLGTLNDQDAQQLKAAGLDYYNHNLDTSERYYKEVITTRPYQERIDTLASVRDAGMKVCCGGIVGMGETREDRVAFLQSLAALPSAPESVPINHLVPVAGTPMAEQEPLDPFEFIRCIAVARILMPTSHVRLSAGREAMDDSTQALAFFAGANSIFYGEQLLTQGNPEVERDQALFARLGLKPEPFRDDAIPSQKRATS